MYFDVYIKSLSYWFRLYLFLKLQEGLFSIGEEYEYEQDFQKEQEIAKELAKGNAVKEEPDETTDEMAVWKDAKLANVLGRHMQSNARGKNDFLKLLKWPREGME